MSDSRGPVMKNTSSSLAILTGVGLFIFALLPPSVIRGGWRVLTGGFAADPSSAQAAARQDAADGDPGQESGAEAGGIVGPGVHDGGGGTSGESGTPRPDLNPDGPDAVARKRDLRSETPAETFQRMKREASVVSMRRWLKELQDDDEMDAAGARRLVDLVYIDPLDPDAAEYEEKNIHVKPGDLFLSGIPMLNQGHRPYCAVASAVRDLAVYGIDVDIEDMARLAETSSNGTSHDKFDRALANLVDPYGLKLAQIDSLEWSRDLIGEYNETARTMGRPRFLSGQSMKTFMRDLDYPVLFQTVNANDAKGSAFEQTVLHSIDARTPLLWSVAMGMVAEETPSHAEPVLSPSDRGEGHMRMIIGYNESTGEVLYSDSWGQGHELKRMRAEDALAITRGLRFLTERTE